MKKIILLVFATVALSGCRKDDDRCDDNLTIPRGDYTGIQLRIDGYYFYDNQSNSAGSFANIYYLYRNGVFFTSGVDGLDKASSGVIEVDVENSFGKRVKSIWGVFQINGSVIEIEHWQASINGCESTVYMRGHISSDTAFVITHREYRRKGKSVKTEAPNSEFRFRPLAQKPDSTNTFVK